MEDLPTIRPAALYGIVNDSRELGFAVACEARVGSLLATLAASKPGGRFLELGTGTGAGAAWLLDGMDADARLISVEQNPDVQAIAVKYLGEDSRATFTLADAGAWLDSYDGEPFDLAFVDSRPGTFERLTDLLNLLRFGGLYVVDDLLPQPTWPEGRQPRVDVFLGRLPEVEQLRATPMAWASGLVVGTRV